MSEKNHISITRVILAVAVVAGVMALFGWMALPSDPTSPYELSRADGKPRFFVTVEPEIRVTPPQGLSLLQEIDLRVGRLMRSMKPAPPKNPNAHSFPPSPVRPCLIPGLLTQCMEVKGTQYLIAVEIAGSVQFGHTNTLNGSQWVNAFERAIETSGPVLCYDFGAKSHFEDSLLLIREKPDRVIIVPRTKLREYQEAGLIARELAKDIEE